MAMPLKTWLTLADFEALIALPENADKTFELIGGELLEVPSNPYVSKIAMKILGELYIYLKAHDIGHVTGEAGGYMIAGERYAPDVAFISYERQPELAQKGYNPNPPELAVEVISDSSSKEEQRNLRLKITGYLAVGVTVLVVDPEARRVELHQVGQNAQEFDETGVITFEPILPNFQLAVKDIFPPRPSPE